MQTNVKSFRCIPEPNIILLVNYLSRKEWHNKELLKCSSSFPYHFFLVSHCLSNMLKWFRFPPIKIYHVTHSFLSGIKTFKNQSRWREQWGGPVPLGITKQAQGIQRHSLRDPETEMFHWSAILLTPEAGLPLPDPPSGFWGRVHTARWGAVRGAEWVARVRELMLPQAAGPLGRGGVQAATGDGWLGCIRGLGLGRPPECV